MIQLILLIAVIYALVKIVAPFCRRPQTREGARQVGQGVNTMGRSAADMYRERRAKAHARRDGYKRYRHEPHSAE